ncbi:MAG: formate dehydrogenase accessory sulfurtransferase FdhD [Mycobacteriaceae bacterium]|nr:formate dehydrogenase accessory sulfurtransferase FdhD [Mycobacteriaceae bacterium]
MGRITTRRPARRVRVGADAGADTQRRIETLAVEEPLEIRVNGSPLAVTMRTPGNDVDLAHGFLLAEGIIGEAAEVLAARYCEGCDSDGRNTYNVLDLTLRTQAVVAPSRNFAMTSACGVCGKTSLEDVRTRTRFAPPSAVVPVAPEVLAAMPDQLRARQRVFDATGGLHAAGLFTPDGAVLTVREDVGRHNAVDKVLGWALRENRVPAHDSVLIVSGRASFELVQKAVMAGVPVLGAVSAPSSLAVDLAADSGLTLAGFLRGDTMNIYTATHRIRS